MSKEITLLVSFKQYQDVTFSPENTNTLLENGSGRSGNRDWVHSVQKNKHWEKMHKQYVVHSDYFTFFHILLLCSLVLKYCN